MISILRRLRQLRQLRIAQAQLRELDDHLLRDIGIERHLISAAAAGEIELPSAPYAANDRVGPNRARRQNAA